MGWPPRRTRLGRRFMPNCNWATVHFFLAASAWYLVLSALERLSSRATCPNERLVLSSSSNAACVYVAAKLSYHRQPAGGVSKGFGVLGHLLVAVGRVLRNVLDQQFAELDTPPLVSRSIRVASPRPLMAGRSGSAILRNCSGVMGDAGSAGVGAAVVFFFAMIRSRLWGLSASIPSSEGIAHWCRDTCKHAVYTGLYR